MSTNIEKDRHLFYWEGGSVSSAYPPTPAFIAAEHPGIALIPKNFWEYYRKESFQLSSVYFMIESLLIMLYRL